MDHKLHKSEEYNNNIVENLREKIRFLEKECRKLQKENVKLKEKPDEVIVEHEEEKTEENRQSQLNSVQNIEFCNWTSGEGSVCSFMCTSKEEMEEHMKNHREVSQSEKCDVCRKTFKDKATLDVHLEIGHIQTKSDQEIEANLMDCIKCRDCPETFHRKKDLMNHRVVEHPSRKKCRNFPKCDWGNGCWYVHPKDSMDLSVYHDTQEEVEVVQNNSTPSPPPQELPSPPPQELPFSCRSCSDKFSSKNQLMNHRKTKHQPQMRPCTLYLSGRCHRSVEQCWYTHAQQVQVTPNPPNPTPAPSSNVVDFPKLPAPQNPPDQITTLTKLVQQMQVTQMKMQEKMEQLFQM